MVFDGAIQKIKCGHYFRHSVVVQQQSARLIKSQNVDIINTVNTLY